MAMRMSLLIKFVIFFTISSCVTKNSKEDHSEVKRSFFGRSCVEPGELNALIKKNFDFFRNYEGFTDYSHFQISEIEAKKIHDRLGIPVLSSIADGLTIWQFAATVTDDRKPEFNVRIDKCLLEEKNTLYCKDGEDTYIHTAFKNYYNLDDKIEETEDRNCSALLKDKLDIKELALRNNEFIPWGASHNATMYLNKKVSPDGSVEVISQADFLKNPPSAVCSLSASAPNWLPAVNKCP